MVTGIVIPHKTDIQAFAHEFTGLTSYQTAVGGREAKAQLRRQLQKLEAQEERLIELAANSSMPIAKVQAKLEQTSLQKNTITEKLNSTEERLKYGAEKALAFIELLRSPGQIYQGADKRVRRDLLTELFKKLLVYVHEDQVTVTSARTVANTAIRELYGQQLASSPVAASDGPENTKPHPWGRREARCVLVPALVHLSMV